jgi:hypothetical protein
MPARCQTSAPHPGPFPFFITPLTLLTLLSLIKCSETRLPRSPSSPLVSAVSGFVMMAACRALTGGDGRRARPIHECVPAGL